MTGSARRSLRPAGPVLLSVALLVGGCGSPSATPPPAATSVAPGAPDPRAAQVEGARGAWQRMRPGTLAYDTVVTDGSGTSSFHVTEMDGRAEVQAMALAQGFTGTVGPDQTIDGIFDAAAAQLTNSPGDVSLTFDTTYAYVAHLERAGALTIDVRDLTTPADRASATRARDQLQALLEAWRTPRSTAWSYTWTRYAAKDTPATATSYTVRFEDGETTVAAAEGTQGTEATSDAATIQATVDNAVGVLSAGGWVDVAFDVANLDALIAVDPSPLAKGDGYWIRIDYTDSARKHAEEALASARSRWASAALARYAYRWRFEGKDEAWGWSVSIKGDVAKLKPMTGAPAVETAFVAPRIEELFDLVERSLAAGASVDARYDKSLGYPTEVTFRGAPDAPDGTITISSFKVP